VDLLSPRHLQISCHRLAPELHRQFHEGIVLHRSIRGPDTLKRCQHLVQYNPDRTWRPTN